MNRLQHRSTATMQICGTLAHDAELRSRVLDGEGHTVPVICLDVVSDGPAHMPVHVEWPQPADGHRAAEQLVKTMKRGTTVTVQAPLLGMRLVAANASQVQASALPSSDSPTEPDLFKGA